MSEVKQRGRPTVKVSFPTSGEFGMNDLVTMNPNTSKVTLQLKINQNLHDGKIKVARLQQNGRGRPAKVYTFMGR